MEGEEQGQSGRKRRKAVPASEESEGPSRKLQRGRPRVEGEDESAAGKRRMQIRLAQRAYRERKESTILTLTEQVENLQKTIEEVQQTFVSFANFAMNSDMPMTYPVIANQLRITVENVVRLCESAKDNTGNLGESESDATPEFVLGKGKEPLNSQAAAQISYNDDWMNPTLSTMQIPTAQPALQQHRPSVDLPLGYVQVFDQFPGAATGGMEEVGHEEQQDASSTSLAPLGSFDDLNFDFHWPTNDQFNVSVNIPRIYPSLSLHQLSSMPMLNLQNLLRQTSVIQAGWIVAMKDTAPDFYQRAFHFCLQLMDNERLLSKYAKVLHRTPEQLLKAPESWAPLIQVGGAGTHFGQKPQLNVLVVKHSSHPSKAIVESQDGSGFRKELEVDWNEFGGEWYDHSDIGGFLTQREFTYNTQTMMGEALVDAEEIPAEIPLANSTNSYYPTTTGTTIADTTFAPSPPSLYNSPTSSTSDPTSPPQNPLSTIPVIPTVPTTFEDTYFSLFPSQTQTYSIDLPDQTILKMGGDMYDPAYTNLHPAANPQSANPLAPFSNTWDVPIAADDIAAWSMAGCALPPAKVRVKVDLAKLVRSLIGQGVCFGRVAGFPRGDVERAFRGSIVAVG